MLARINRIAEVIEDDGLINDYEFKRDIYKAGLVEDLQNYLCSHEMIFSGAIWKNKTVRKKGGIV